MGAFSCTNEHGEMPHYLQESLHELVEASAANAGGLLYIDPSGAEFRMESGCFSTAGRERMETDQRSLRRRQEDVPPSPIAIERILVLPLTTGCQLNGLVHLELPGPAADLERDKGLLAAARAIGRAADRLSAAQQSQQDVNLLLRVSQRLTTNLDLTSLLDEIMTEASEALRAEASSILLVDHERGQLVFTLAQGTAEAGLAEYSIPLGAGVAGWVAQHEVGQIVNNAPGDHRWDPRVDSDTGFVTRSLIAVPVIVRGRVMGVVEVLNHRDGAPFTERDLELLTSFAAQAGIAMENARLYHDLKQERDRLLTKEEEVRRAIARDLHDDLAQSIAAIAMRLDMLPRSLRMDPRVGTILQGLQELVQSTNRSVRTMLFTLRPLKLETQGLVPTLREYVERRQQPGMPALSLEVTGWQCRLPQEVAGALFMIIQEAVNNAIKHAGTPVVRIRLAEEQDGLVAEVIDNGTGFDTKAVAAGYDERGSLGLLNMRERARLIGARFALRSAPGSGTTASVYLPLDVKTGKPLADGSATATR